jgi:imidazolonepropionase-like amidohydrolase
LTCDTAYKAAKKYGVGTAFGTDILGKPELQKRHGAMLAKHKRWCTPHVALKIATHDNAQ